MSRAGVGRNGIDGKHCRSAVGGTDGALRERCRWHSRGADGSTAEARLERRRSTVGAQLEHGISTVRTRSERSRSAEGNAAGVRLVAQTERGGSAVGRSGMDEKNCRGGGAPAII